MVAQAAVTWIRGNYMSWYPHITVATIVEHEGKFLIVEELDDGEIVFNQPAGHLEIDESLIAAAVRETLEETGWLVEPIYIVDLSLYESGKNNTTYFRTTFAAKALEQLPEAKLDEGIIQPRWLTLEELKSGQFSLRSPMVTYVIERYLSGIKYPLELVTYHG
jgi:8-oxo-dGTP pyrophosphatase MutT (NUDIX family)